MMNTLKTTRRQNIGNVKGDNSMACMYHQCSSIGCNWEAHNNIAAMSCPQCGAPVISTFDEDMSDYDTDLDMATDTDDPEDNDA